MKVRVCLLSRCPGLPFKLSDSERVIVSVIPHAHNQTTDPNFGTICINPGETMESILHELAHLQAPGDGHGSAWLARMDALGLRAGAFYFLHALAVRTAYKASSTARPIDLL